MHKKFFIPLILCIFSQLAWAQDITFSTEEEHAEKWLNATTNFTGLPVNSYFPEEEFSTLTGETIRIAGGEKKLYVLHFWFVGCGAYQQEEEYLRKLREDFREYPEVAFISFCSSPKEEIEKYLSLNDSPGYQLVSMGSKEKTKEHFGVAASTTHMLLDPQGKILENFTATIDFDEMYDHYKNRIMEKL